MTVISGRKAQKKKKKKKKKKKGEKENIYIYIYIYHIKLHFVYCLTLQIISKGDVIDKDPFRENGSQINVKGENSFVTFRL